MKEFIFFADCNSTYSLRVKAKNLKEAQRIAEEADGGEWHNDEWGRLIIDHDLTEEIKPSGDVVR